MTRPVVAEAPIALPPDRAALVLLVDDQILVGEAIRRSLLNEPDIAFHYNPEPGTAL